MSKTRSVFITGANRGIGLDLVKQINERFRPEFLIATFRNKDQAKGLHEYAAAHGNVNLIQMEITDESKYPEIVKQVNELTGGSGLNLLINNAGILERSGLEAVNKASMLQHFEVNTIAPILITQAFLPLLEKAGSVSNDPGIGIGRAAVVNISTKMGSIADNTSGSYYAYRSSKCALNMATKSLSVDLIGKNIMAVVIHPGWVQTDMGGSSALLTIADSVQNIVNTLEGLNESHNGSFLNYDGKPIPW